MVIAKVFPEDENFCVEEGCQITINEDNSASKKLRGGKQILKYLIVFSPTFIGNNFDDWR